MSGHESPTADWTGLTDGGDIASGLGAPGHCQRRHGHFVHERPRCISSVLCATGQDQTWVSGRVLILRAGRPLAPSDTGHGLPRQANHDEANNPTFWDMGHKA